MLVISILVFAIPIKSLSQESFKLRSSTSGLNFSEEQKTQIKTKFKQDIDTTKLDFFEWINAKSLNENAIFKGKKFKGTGFITPGPTNDTFELSRFVVSCCVVDATPVSLTTEYQDYQKKFKVDDWVEITGQFEIKTIKGKEQPVIVPIDVNNIPTPADIYLPRN